MYLLLRFGSTQWVYNVNIPSSSTGDSQINDSPGWWNWMLGLLELAEAEGKRVVVGCSALV